MTRSIVRCLGCIIVSIVMVAERAAAQDSSESFADWSLKKMRTGFSLDYRAYSSQGGAIKTANFAFACDRAGKIGAIIIPFESTYDNQKQSISVYIERSHDPTASPHLTQQWGNGYKYIFLNGDDQVGALANYLKAAEADGEEAVEVLFAGNFNGRTDVLKIVVGLSDFSKGFSRLEAVCAETKGAP